MQPHPSFKPGDTVRTVFGATRIVREQAGPNGCMVFLDDEPDWYHPSKLRRLVPATTAS